MTLGVLLARFAGDDELERQGALTSVCAVASAWHLFRGGPWNSENQFSHLFALHLCDQHSVLSSQLPVFALLYTSSFGAAEDSVWPADMARLGVIVSQNIAQTLECS